MLTFFRFKDAVLVAISVDSETLSSFQTGVLSWAAFVRLANV